MLLEVLIVAGCVAFSFYYLLWKAMPTYLWLKILHSPWGSFLLDFTMFAGTTSFMVYLAGPSLLAMSIGAASGVLASGMIALHRLLTEPEEETKNPFLGNFSKPHNPKANAWGTTDPVSA